MIRQDYIVRMIQQVGQALARMLGATKREDFLEARVQANEAYDLLGIPADLTLIMDSPSLAGFIGNPDKIRLVADVLWHEGELLRANRDPINGLDRQRRAVELLLEAQRLDPQPEDASKLQEMCRYVPTACLAERYRVGL